MNFSAFGSHFSGLQFTTTKFENGPTFAAAQQDSGRYHSPNNFQQNLAVSSPQILQQPPQQQFTQSVPYNGNGGEHSFVNPNNNNGNGGVNNGGGEHKPSTNTILHHTSVKVPTVKTDRDAREDALNQQILQNVNQSWQTLASANPTSSTVDYSSHILSATLPISIQHFLKYSETIKKESGVVTPNGSSPTTTTNANLINGNGGLEGNNGVVNEVPTTTSTGKKKKKKSQKAPKVRAVREKKPRPKPGEIRETKALDGSTLFCCPECQMAYPDRSLIEQHVISHAVERRFVCDICNAALKRKDHLTRHKLSHIPDRPHICNICMKSFKRKEQLTLHFVIHSGEKKHVCQECGKGFYRKDHLRKHTRSHIARRVKSEVTSQGSTATSANTTNGSTASNTAANSQAP